MYQRPSREVAAITRLAWVGLLSITVLLAALSGTAGAQSSSVEAVTVSVTAGDVPPPARVIKRMEQSVATVGEHVLAGRKIAEVESSRGTYEKIIKEVFDRVLVGYSVQEVAITPGETTLVAVRLAPWGDIVRRVVLETDMGAIAPAAAALVRQDMGDIEGKLGQVLIGMPVESVDWAGSVSKSVIREILAAQLPEFRANLEITAGTVTTVKLSLMPSGPLVQDAMVSLRSKTIPNFLLLEARPAVEETAQVMRGLPVAFVERHGEYFRQMAAGVAVAQPMVKRYSLNLKTVLKPGVDSELAINAETTKYKVALEGYLDMGRRTDNTSARLHVGSYLGQKDEVFAEVTFIPGTMTWIFAPGFGHRLGPQSEAGLKYNFSDKAALVWLKQELGGNWSLRLERTPVSGHNEFAIRYKLHEFLSAEYIFTTNDHWLRLVGNL